MKTLSAVCLVCVALFSVSANAAKSCPSHKMIIMNMNSQAAQIIDANGVQNVPAKSHGAVVVTGANFYGQDCKKVSIKLNKSQETHLGILDPKTQVIHVRINRDGSDSIIDSNLGEFGFKVKTAIKYHGVDPFMKS